MAYDSIVAGGGVLTQDYGLTAFARSCQCEWRCPARGSRGYDFHAGLDVARLGVVTLLAVGYGTRVMRTRAPGSCGGLGPFAVCINSGPIDVWYGHASRDLVGIGARVAPGQPVAIMGSLGCSTGQHVHYEVQPAGSVDGCASLDPRPYLNSWPGRAPAPPPGPTPAPSIGLNLALLGLGGLGLAAYARWRRR